MDTLAGSVMGSEWYKASKCLEAMSFIGDSSVFFEAK